MTKFAFDIDFPHSPEHVFDAFWSLETWPHVARHVTKIEMRYEDPSVQVLVMHVETGGRKDAFKTVRIRQGYSIFYFQPKPPPALSRHSGWWHIIEGPEGSCVRSEHSFEIVPDAARRFLESTGRPANDEAAVLGGIEDVLHHNSRQTMVALRNRMEAESVAAQDLPAKSSTATPQEEMRHVAVR